MPGTHCMILGLSQTKDD